MNYDPTKVQVVVNGFTVTGFAEGSMISVSRNTDKREMDVGADGTVDFIESADDTAIMNITLKHGSPANQKLQELYDSGEEFTVAVVDQNFDGDVGHSGSRCKVGNLADDERTDSMAEREWPILIADHEAAFEGVL